MVRLSQSVQYPSQDQSPLTPDEIREGALRIEQLILARREAELLKQALTREQELAERERQLAERELSTEKQRSELASKETSIQKDRADFYEMAFKEATKGRSFGCKLAKVLTIGLAKCR